MRNSHRRPNILNAFPCRTDFFKILFFHVFLMNGLNLIQTFVALAAIIYFAMENLNNNDPFRIKMLTGLRSGFSDHKFRRYFIKTH